MKLAKGNWTHLVGVKPVTMMLALLFASTSPLISYELKVLVFLVAGFIFIPQAGRMSKSTFLLGLVFTSVILTSFINDLRNTLTVGSNTQSFYYIPICLAVGYLIAQAYTMEHFLRCMDRVMFPFSIISLFVFTLISISPDIASSLPSYTFGDLEHRTTILVNIIYADGFLIHRNPGFASEPGVFQILLNFALYQTIKDQGIRNIRVVVYITTILTGASTIGLLIMMIVLFTFASWRAKVALFILMAITSPYLASIVVDQTETKLVGSTAFDIRFLPTLSALNTAIKNPMGIGSVEYDKRFESEEFGSFDAYTQTALRYGWQGVGILVISLLLLSRRSFGAFLILTLSLFSQPLWYLPIFSCFLWWGVTSPSRTTLIPHRRPALASQTKAICPCTCYPSLGRPDKLP